jgi:hypothetical protein
MIKTIIKIFKSIKNLLSFSADEEIKNNYWESYLDRNVRHK